MNLASSMRARRMNAIATTLVPAGTVLAALALAGCTVTRPAVRPLGASAVAEGGGALQLSVELELSNPGDDEIELVQYDYTLRGSDGSSYTGRWAALLALPPQTTTRTSIPAVVPAGPTDRRWSLDGSLTYRDPKSLARLLYELGVVKPETGFEGRDLAVGASESK